MQTLRPRLRVFDHLIGPTPVERFPDFCIHSFPALHGSCQSPKSPGELPAELLRPQGPARSVPEGWYYL